VTSTSVSWASVSRNKRECLGCAIPRNAGQQGSVRRSFLRDCWLSWTWPVDMAELAELGVSPLGGTAGSRGLLV
jgi:hypothetical protein